MRLRFDLDNGPDGPRWPIIVVLTLAVIAWAGIRLVEIFVLGH